MWPILLVHGAVCLFAVLYFVVRIRMAFRSGTTSFIVFSVDRANPLYYLMVLLYLAGIVIAISFIYNDLEQLGFAPHLGLRVPGVSL